MLVLLPGLYACVVASSIVLTVSNLKLCPIKQTNIITHLLFLFRYYPLNFNDIPAALVNLVTDYLYCFLLYCTVLFPLSLIH